MNNMKKTVIAAAVAAIVAAPAVFAEATVYGKARVSIDSLDFKAAGGADGIRVSDRVSRIGVKGSEDLGDGMKAIFGMEWGVDLADTGALAARNQFVGLSGGFGTVLAGRHDTPYKMVGSADLFADTVADSQANTTGIIGRNGFDNRAANAVAYVSPSLNGWTILAAGVAGEDYTDPKANGLTDAISLGLTGAVGPVKVGLGYETFNKNLGGGTEDKVAIKGDVKYSMGDLALGLTYETSNASYTTSDKDTGLLLSAAYSMGNNVLAVQYGNFDAKADGGDLTRVVVGLVHNFSKNTSAYVAYMSDDGKAAGDAADVTGITVGLNTAF
jgi:predicted porin